MTEKKMPTYRAGDIVLCKGSEYRKLADYWAKQAGQNNLAERLKELADIEDMIDAGQGDDDGMQIMPDFEPGMSIIAKVEECLHLLEKRRDVIAGYEARAERYPDAPPTVLDEIVAERRRQVEVEGWTPEHDDAEHDAGEFAGAASAYALNAACVLHPLNGTPMDQPPESWTFERAWWKPKSPREDLVRAGALILAEIEKMDREAARL